MPSCYLSYKSNHVCLSHTAANQNKTFTITVNTLITRVFIVAKH